MALVSQINNDSYTKIPDEIVKAAGLKPGDDIIWYYDEATKQIILMEKPKNFAKAMRGLGKELWKDASVEAYIEKERSAWE